jgi:hypothetical protein
MSRAAWVGLSLAIASRAAAAGVPFVVSAQTTFGEDVGVVVTIENTSGQTLAAVHPEIRHRLVERHGEPTVLAAGGRHAWHTSFPLPRGPYGDALIVLVRWQDEAGTTRSIPWAGVVETPGLLPTEAQVLLEPGSGPGHERALVRITNATADPLRARLVALLPEEFFTTPVAQAVEAPPRQSVTVPIDVQSHGPPGTTYPLYAILQFEQGGVPRAIVAATQLGIGVSPSRSALRPLAVGGTALAVVVAGLLAANRRAARLRRR